jgi:hypothetical protein
MSLFRRAAEKFMSRRELVRLREPGQVFIPFHYGYWDDVEKAKAANELTTDTWDFISEQPVFKSGAVRVEPAGVEIHGVHRPKVLRKWRHRQNAKYVFLNRSLRNLESISLL